MKAPYPGVFDSRDNIGEWFFRRVGRVERVKTILIQKIYFVL
jgi:hypothetical protein